MKEAGYEVTQEEGSIEGKGGGVKRWKKEQKVYKGREEKARRDQQVSEKKKRGGECSTGEGREGKGTCSTITTSH